MISEKNIRLQKKRKSHWSAIKGELTIAQISSKYGTHATQIHAWKKQMLSLLPDIFRKKHTQDAMEHNTELAALYEQIGRLKVENDFLKKKFEMLGD